MNQDFHVSFLQINDEISLPKLDIHLKCVNMKYLWCFPSVWACQCQMSAGCCLRSHEGHMVFH